MANIKTALVARAGAHSGLTALIGPRFYAYNRVPQEIATPYVTFQKTSSRRNHTMGGDTGLVSAMYRIEAWDATQDGAEAVAGQLKACFNRFHGTSDTIAMDTILDDERDATSLEQTFARLFRVRCDFKVFYREP